MSDLPKLWNERVTAVLREAEANGWIVPSPTAQANATYDPLTKRITSSGEIPTLLAQDMLARGVAMIDHRGRFVLVDGEPLPPNQRTTHITTIVVRQAK